LGSFPSRTIRRVALVCWTLAASLAATSVVAQDAATAQDGRTLGSWGLPFTVSVGISMHTLDDARKCSFSDYSGLGLELQRGGTIFVVAGAELLDPGGSSEACLPLPPRTALPDGRVLIEGFPQVVLGEARGHFRAGIGAAIRGQYFEGEVRVLAGTTRGQEDFEADWFPTLSASLGIVVARHVFVHVERRWFRIPQWSFVSDDPGAVPFSTHRPPGSETRFNWQRMGGVSLGWRF
jgi:hypothetical protein